MGGHREGFKKYILNKILIILQNYFKLLPKFIYLYIYNNKRNRNKIKIKYVI